jgi:hypothetical protein
VKDFWNDKIKPMFGKKEPLTPTVGVGDLTTEIINDDDAEM